MRRRHRAQPGATEISFSWSTNGSLERDRDEVDILAWDFENDASTGLRIGPGMAFDVAVANFARRTLVGFDQLIGIFRRDQVMRCFVMFESCGLSRYRWCGIGRGRCRLRCGPRPAMKKRQDDEHGCRSRAGPAEITQQTKEKPGQRCRAKALGCRFLRKDVRGQQIVADTRLQVCGRRGRPEELAKVFFEFSVVQSSEVSGRGAMPGERSDNATRWY